MSLNKVMLIGNVGRDPEVRYLDGGAAAGGQGTKVATFTLATSERYRDRNGELRENTEWHNIVAWRNSADIAEKYIHKGSQIYVEGKLRTRSWTDQAGVKKYQTEIAVDTLQLLGRREDSQSGYQGGYQASGNAQSSYRAPQPSYQPSYQAPVQQTPVQQAPAQQPISMDLDDNAPDDLPF